MTESSITERGAPDQADTRRRIWAIVGASSGNLVEWFDFLRLFILLALFRPYLFSIWQYHHPTAADGRRICRRIPDASHRRMAVWSNRRPPRT